MQQTVYQYNTQGYYLGVTIALKGIMPNNTTTTKPTLKDGFIPKWNRKSWEQVENHIGEKGFVNNEPHVIKEYGAYPTGWTAEKVLSNEEIALQNETEAKILRDQIIVSNITVDGAEYQVDDAGKQNINETIDFAVRNNLPADTQQGWILADNTLKEVTVADLYAVLDAVALRKQDAFLAYTVWRSGDKLEPFTYGDE